MSVTLAEFFSAFTTSWHNESARPQPVILDDMYDWDTYYENHIDKVACYTKTKNSQSYVRAFKFARNPNGLVGVRLLQSGLAVMELKMVPGLWCSDPYPGRHHSQ